MSDNGGFGPINPKFPHFLHGGDYNPDQWPSDVWDDDMRLAKLAHCNAMSVGIFSWAQLEPEEGRFTFDWLDTIMDKLSDNGAVAILATPSAAQPAWMSAKYPEVLRVDPGGHRVSHGNRVAYCLTSPVYRTKCAEMSERLAERYGKHPALVLWHISNEYTGAACHCELCKSAFREWLKRKFGTLDALNAAWWTGFWSHTYSDWGEINPPGSPYNGDGTLMGLKLDWRRFLTDQTITFIENETAPLRRLTPDVPVTTNFMGTYPFLDYSRIAPVLDVISWDSYPCYNGRGDMWEAAARISFIHDLNRGFKSGKPFMLMESTPSVTNWEPVSRLKRPGMHKLESLQAVAHGADTVQYFQWRAGRGGSEKFHGAVVAHNGTEDTRVFRDVAEVGRILENLDPVIGSAPKPEVAVIYDWENSWAIDFSHGPRVEKRNYEGTCIAHYKPFWKAGAPVDVIGENWDFTPYKLLIAPMLYMVKPGVAERIEEFVAAGGTFVATYWSGIADENDLCFYGGRPGPLRKLLGIWSEEIDALYDDEMNSVHCSPGNALGITGEFAAHTFCDLIHPETAETIATYGQDFYAGRAAVTVNRFGKGSAYYVAARTGDDFIDGFYQALIKSLGIARVLDTEIPAGVTVQHRMNGDREFVFILNFTREERSVSLGDGKFRDMATGAELSGMFDLPVFGSAVLEYVL